MPTWVLMLLAMAVLGSLLWMLFYKFGILIWKLIVLVWRGLVWLFRKVFKRGDSSEPETEPQPEPRTGNLNTDETVLLRSAIGITRDNLIPDSSGLPQDVRDTLTQWLTAESANLDPANDRQLLTEIAWYFAGIIQDRIDDLNEEATKVRLNDWADVYKLEVNS